MKTERVLVMGASDNRARYAYIATEMLKAHGHEPVLFGSRKGSIFGIPISDEWGDFGEIDTVTLYMNPLRQQPFMEKIVALKPARVIFNPGTENPIFYGLLDAHGIESEVACTLVLLSTGQY